MSHGHISSYFKMNAWSISMLFLLHSPFILNVVKMLLKGEVGGHALNSHANYIVEYGKSWKNHGIVFLNFWGNPVELPLMAVVLFIFSMLSWAFWPPWSMCSNNL